MFNLLQSKRVRLQAEVLEDRCQPATFTVSSLTDSGLGSLREQLALAAVASGQDRIEFSQSLFTIGPRTITLESELAVNSDVQIIGPGANLLTLSGNNNSRVLSVSPNIIAEVMGLSIAAGGGVSFGAGISNEGDLTLNACEVRQNTAVGGFGVVSAGLGGGIYNTGTLVVQNSAIVENSATGRVGTASLGAGGGIYSTGTVLMTSSTLANNTAQGANNLFAGVGGDARGGGIAVDNGTFSVSFSTISGNTANGGNGQYGIGSATGGGISVYPSGPASASFGSTIISSNTAAGFSPIGPNISGVITSFGYNLVSNLSGANGFVFTDILNVDPLLGPLSYNGGPTRTMEISENSPARDAGDPSTLIVVDQNGLPRVSNGRPDIGAVEFQVSPPPVSPPPVSPPPVSPLPLAQPVRIFALSGDSGAGPLVKVYNIDGTERFTILAYDAGFTGGVRVAVGDVSGDGVPDIIAAPGVGTAPVVKVFSGVDGLLFRTIDAFEMTFTGGVFLAVADFDRDGLGDVVVSPDQGGGPRVRIFGGSGGQIADFFGIEDPDFRGGTRIGSGDINGDGIADLLVGAGFGGGPRLATFDGVSLSSEPRKLFSDFFAFEEGLRNGMFVAAGNLNNDGAADIILGAGPGGAPRVRGLDGRALLNSDGSDLIDLVNFFAGDTSLRGGVRVGVANLSNDGRDEILTVGGEGTNSDAHAYSSDGSDMGPIGSFNNFTGGLFIAGTPSVQPGSPPVSPPPVSPPPVSPTPPQASLTFTGAVNMRFSQRLPNGLSKSAGEGMVKFTATVAETVSGASPEVVHLRSGILSFAGGPSGSAIFRIYSGTYNRAIDYLEIIAENDPVTVSNGILVIDAQIVQRNGNVTAARFTSADGVYSGRGPI